MPVLNKVTVTINGTAIKVLQGTNAFKDIVGAGAERGACSVNSKLITVVSTPSQGSTVNPNSSYNIQGGEVLTIA